MLSKRHHELKISYLKHRLKNMPQGTWGVKRGKRVINITFDPMDPGVDSYHKKTINHDSKYEYFEEQFREFKDIVFLRMVDSQVFDPEEYRSLIRFAIEANIDDIILE